MRYAIVIEKTESNCSANVPDLPVASPQTPRWRKSKTRIREATEFHLEGMREDGICHSRTCQPGRVRRYCGMALQRTEVLMKRSEFTIGREFWCGGKRWRCTDTGTRVIVAICLEPHEIVTVTSGKGQGEPGREVRHVTDDPSWHLGPPYAVEECVFGENDMPACSITAEANAS